MLKDTTKGQRQKLKQDSIDWGHHQSGFSLEQAARKQARENPCKARD